MLYLTLLKVLFVVIIINVVLNNGENIRLSKTKTTYIGKNRMDGKYDALKYEDKSLLKPSNEEKDEEITIDKIKGKTNYRSIDRDGNEYLYEIDDNELSKLIERGMLLLKESSNKDEISNDDDDDNKAKEKEEDEENKRKLMILGSDTRWEITAANWHPTNKIGLLTSSGTNCTATLIGPTTILTAGHCLHSGKDGNWYNNFRFYPAKSSTIPSIGYSMKRAMVFEGYRIADDYNYDMGLIELWSSPNVGWMSFGYDNSINTDWLIFIKGYPNDKAYGSMWSTSDNIGNVYENQLRTYDSDTVSGMDGGAVYSYHLSSSGKIYGVHSGSGMTGWFINFYNRHTRMTSYKYGIICAWMDNSNIC